MCLPKVSFNYYNNYNNGINMVFACCDSSNMNWNTKYLLKSFSTTIASQNIIMKPRVIMYVTFPANHRENEEGQISNRIQKK